MHWALSAPVPSMSRSRCSIADRPHGSDSIQVWRPSRRRSASHPGTGRVRAALATVEDTSPPLPVIVEKQTGAVPLFRAASVVPFLAIVHACRSSNNDQLL
jgi:hypothetical protein